MTTIQRIAMCAIAILLIDASAGVRAQQPQDPIRQGSRWHGKIVQGNQSFPATIYFNRRANERIQGEIHFSVGAQLNKLTFQGNVIDKDTVAWITDKKEGTVTYPGLYFGKINGNRISGIWQVPSAGQYDQFDVTLTK